MLTYIIGTVLNKRDQRIEDSYGDYHRFEEEQVMTLLTGIEDEAAMMSGFVSDEA